MNFTTLSEITRLLVPQFIQNPFVCPGCKEPARTGVCKICISSLRKNDSILFSQSSGIRGIFPIYYSHSTAHAIFAHWKHNSGERLERSLFQMSGPLKHELKALEFDQIIPIPQNEFRSLKRGHESAFQAARYFSKELNIPLIRSLRLKQTPSQKQTQLSEWERIHSQNPFIYAVSSPDHSPLRVLIVDDFITTGSTLQKAANAILSIRPQTVIYGASLGWKLPTNSKMTKSLTK